MIIQILIAIFLLCFGYGVYYVIKLLIKQRLTEADSETFVQPVVDSPDKPNIRDSHYFLTTAIKPGKKSIVELKPSLSHLTNYFYLNPKGGDIELPDPNVVTHTPSKLSYPKLKSKLTCIPQNHPIRKVVQKLQPYMWEQPEIITYYDQPYYRDWRYNLQPVDIRFAANPEKYCLMYPTSYPCSQYLKKW